MQTKLHSQRVSRVKFAKLTKLFFQGDNLSANTSFNRKEVVSYPSLSDIKYLKGRVV